MDKPERKLKQPMLEGNGNAKKHNAYGLKKRVETGLTTKDDYQRYVALLDRWNLTPAQVQAMGMVGSAVEAKAWLGLIAEDATGGYLFVKENSDDLELITRLGRNATYQLDKFSRGLPELEQAIRADDGSIEAAILSARGKE